MFKIYLDWSVITAIKQGKLTDLKTMLLLNNNFTAIYSTSHISDIFISYDGTEEHQGYIDEDLELIKEITNSNCAYIEHNEVVINSYDPFELFKQRINDKSNLVNDNWAKSSIEQFESGSYFSDALKKRFAEPLPTEILLALSDPNLAVRMQEHFPGLNSNSNFGDLANIFIQRYKRLVGTDEYKNLRENVQRTLNISSNDISGKQPFDVINDLYNNSIPGLETLLSPTNSYAPRWFQEIANNYIVLDMHGFHQDKIKVSKNKQDTMRNLIDDGFHAAFASLCDFYITLDSKATFKTKEVYKKLNIKTIVFTPTEFIEHFDKLVSQKETKSINKMIEIDLQFLKESETILKQISELGDENEKANELVKYLTNSKNLLLQFGLSINAMLVNQQRIVDTFNIYNDSLAKLLERIEGMEKLSDIYSDHLGALDGITDSHSTRFDIYDQFLELLSKRIDLLEN